MIHASERMSLKYYSLREYQKHVQKQILSSLVRNKFVVTMMPTGSGKTILQMSLAKNLSMKERMF